MNRMLIFLGISLILAVNAFAVDEPLPVLYYSFDEDIGDEVEDLSGNENTGKFFGGAAWLQEGDRPVVALDGNGYIWPLCSPNLTLGPPCTMVLNLKPEGAGYLLYWGWNFSYRVVGNPPLFALSYQLHAGKPVQSKPYLASGEWQTLAIVAADEQVKLYGNGKLVEALPAELRAGNWGLHNTSTWHRHLSFFGGGPGDMTLRYGGRVNGVKGQVGSLVIYRRALTEEEIAALAQPATAGGARK